MGKHAHGLIGILLNMSRILTISSLEWAMLMLSDCNKTLYRASVCSKHVLDYTFTSLAGFLLVRELLAVVNFTSFPSVYGL